MLDRVSAQAVAISKAERLEFLPICRDEAREVAAEPRRVDEPCFELADRLKECLRESRGGRRRAQLTELDTPYGTSHGERALDVGCDLNTVPTRLDEVSEQIVERPNRPRKQRRPAPERGLVRPGRRRSGSVRRATDPQAVRRWSLHPQIPPARMIGRAPRGNAPEAARPCRREPAPRRARDPSVHRSPGLGRAFVRAVTTICKERGSCRDGVRSPGPRPPRRPTSLPTSGGGRGERRPGPAFPQRSRRRDRPASSRALRRCNSAS